MTMVFSPSFSMHSLSLLEKNKPKHRRVLLYELTTCSLYLHKTRVLRFWSSHWLWCHPFDAPKVSNNKELAHVDVSAWHPPNCSFGHLIKNNKMRNREKKKKRKKNERREKSNRANALLNQSCLHCLLNSPCWQIIFLKMLMQIRWSNLDTGTAVHLWGKGEEGEMVG